MDGVWAYVGLRPSAGDVMKRRAAEWLAELSHRGAAM
jgi:hypothetical protein